MAFTTRKVFQVGDEVEVCSKQDGFHGSYYEGIVIENLGDKYKVKYKNLVEEDDMSTALEELAEVDEVRPVCPKVWPDFFPGEKVDAFANDGWWAGIITRKSGDDWFVYFPSTFEHIAYPKKHIRLHLESRRNGWVSRDGRVFSCEGKPLSCKKRLRIVMGGSSSTSVKARLV